MLSLWCCVARQVQLHYSGFQSGKQNKAQLPHCTLHAADSRAHHKALATPAGYNSHSNQLKCIFTIPKPTGSETFRASSTTGISWPLIWIFLFISPESLNGLKTRILVRGQLFSVKEMEKDLQSSLCCCCVQNIDILSKYSSAGQLFFFWWNSLKCLSETYGKEFQWMAKQNKKFLKNHCVGKILYELNLKWCQNWILQAIRWKSFNRRMSTCCAAKLFVFRFEGLHKAAQVHSCFHNMMRTNCILLVCHFVFLRSLTVSFVGVTFVSRMLVWRFLSCSYFICRRANTIAIGSYLSSRSGVNKD